MMSLETDPESPRLLLLRAAASARAWAECGWVGGWVGGGAGAEWGGTIHWGRTERIACIAC